jgi:hypothetical protein
LPSFDPPARVTQSPTLDAECRREADYFVFRAAGFFFAVVFFAVFLAAVLVFDLVAFFAMLPS